MNHDDIRGYCIASSGYLTQIASMADASEVITDGPLVRLRENGMIWVPLVSKEWWCQW